MSALSIVDDSNPSSIESNVGQVDESIDKAEYQVPIVHSGSVRVPDTGRVIHNENQIEHATNALL